LAAQAPALGKRSVRELELEPGARVLLRVDFNVPLDGGEITDDARIRAALPTLELLLERGARPILCSHLGRPKDSEPETSLKPASGRLAELIDAPVAQASDVVGEDARAKAEAMKPGHVLVLENTRWEAGETENSPELAEALADLADAYVNDAFGAAHRAHASSAGVAKHLPSAAGLLLEREVTTLRGIVEAPERPLVVVLGGAKVSDKLAVIESLLPKVDRLLVGGGMCFTFMAAEGLGVGSSLLEADMIDTCKRLLGDAGDKIMLPADVVIADEFTVDASTESVLSAQLREGWMGLDIGPITAERYGAELDEAATVFWNGPMGVFEMAPFAAGTQAVARSIVDSKAYSVVGGGDSAAAVRALGLPEDGFSHISTGGGASLEYLEGKPLPGIEVLEGS
jgi:phosphoglycerate kinase